ncbi:aspartate aminotransferase family protein [Pelagibius marinus]|uniref:aspartate aminotransferase family protein n=1 Tax=Pelagibius marinus TaxID=2762760 RepID=UPI0018729D08|nr:aspartate aminotransferase family protein [Pelagibius marinus]
MTFDLSSILAERQGEKYALNEKYLNAQLVRVLKTLGYDVNFARGQGPHLYDVAGRRYLDLLSGFGVFALGRNHPAVAAALRQVLEAQLPGLVQLDVSLLAGILAEKLLARLPGMERIFFCNSGAEAVEAAIKFARMATGRPRILYCDQAFHGLTYGALSLNGTEVFRKGFGPLLPECVKIPFNDLTALEAALKAGAKESEVAAFIVEPIQGKGVYMPDDNYLAEAARLCRKYGALFVADEIQTGLGRTGRFLACEHYGVEPDMVLLAKALSGGFVPVGAVAMKHWIFAKLFDRMDRALVHGSTFGKNDMAMAAGIATLEVMEEEKLVEKADSRGSALMADLQKLVAQHELLKEVRGRGMMIGLEFGAPKSLKLKAAWHLLDSAKRGLFCQMVLIPLLRDHQILCQVSGDDSYIIKLLPSLTIDEADRQWIVSAFDQVIGDCHQIGGAVWDLGRSLAKHGLKAKAG